MFRQLIYEQILPLLPLLQYHIIPRTNNLSDFFVFITFAYRVCLTPRIVSLGNDLVDNIT